MKECITHHYACDCREAQRKQLEQQLAEANAENDEQARLLGLSGSREAKLLAQLSEAQAEIEKLQNFIRVNAGIDSDVINGLQAEIARKDAALEKIKERCDKRYHMGHACDYRGMAQSAHDIAANALAATQPPQQPEQAQQWQPIETAPKGIIVDLWTTNGRATNCIQDSIYGWLSPESQFVKGVTHWMPLPPPPQGSEE